MWKWLSHLVRRVGQRPLLPESKIIVTFDEELISVRDETGKLHTMRRNELSAVVIETNDTGPWGTDLWWLLFGADGRVALIYPGGATGEQEMLSFILALPGARKREVSRAMGCTDVARFLVWER